MRVLVLCTHNSARSQMAEGWLRHHARAAGLAAEVHSAGTQATRVKPEAVEIMREVGIDMRGRPATVAKTGSCRNRPLLTLTRAHATVGSLPAH